MIKGRFSILQKGFILIGVPIAFQLAFVALFLRVQNDAAMSEHWALHTKDVIAQAEGTFRQLLQEFSDTRSAVLMGGESAEVEAARRGDPADLRGEVSQLHSLVSDNPSQVQNVEVFRADADKLLDWIAGVNDLLKNNKKAEAEVAVKGVAIAQTVEQLRTQLDRILAVEQKLDSDRVQSVAQVRSRIHWLLTISALLALGLATALLIAFSRGIASRMSALQAKALELGERRPLGQMIGGNDEIADVDRAFHETAARLAALHAAEKDARDEIERRANELTRVNQDLSAKTLENETFVYSVSHDLRSPLVNLQGFSRELADACEELRRITDSVTDSPESSRKQLLNVLDKDVKESIDFIQTAVSRASSIIDALLRLSRAGRIEYNWTVVPMRAIVHRIVDAMQSVIRQRGATVIAAEEFPDAYGDATAIEQILGNLIGNAVNYIDPNRPGHIEVGAIPGSSETSKDRPEVKLQTYFVRDNGVGIPAAYLPKIFVAFQRLHGQLAPGEGIGLALVQRMVERHGGRVWIESSEGQGTTFFVALPTPPVKEIK